MKTKTLYRPVGIKELELIADTDWKEFPPRLEWQPIFYPVLNQAYAEQIAMEWNTEDSFSGYCGIVTRFVIQEEHFLQYNAENVGAEMHNELWVPAEMLSTFNQNIVGKIEVVNVFFGSAFLLPEHKLVREELLKFKS
jgi:hypothetical protein